MRSWPSGVVRRAGHLADVALKEELQITGTPMALRAVQPDLQRIRRRPAPAVPLDQPVQGPDQCTP